VLHKAELGNDVERLEGTLQREAQAYQDYLASDAYPIQLLGEGYPRHLATDSEWRTTELGASRLMVEHVDPAAWLRELTLEEAIAGDSIPGPALLARARECLAAILFPAIPWQQLGRIHESRDRPDVWLPQSIVAEVQALPRPSEGEAPQVALLMNDGQVLENVQLSAGGAVVAHVAGGSEFTLHPHDIIEVLDRSTS
jgi:hypothetical protein